MRSSLIVASLLLWPASALRSENALRAPVEVAVTGFSAALSDGRVIATWRRYKRDDFGSYQVVKSSAKADPVYPQDPAIFSSDAAGELRFEDGKLSLGTWHYRLCIVTRFGDRWLSQPVTVVVDEKALKRAAPTAADFE